MIRYVSVDAAGRIMATTEFEEYAEGMRLFEFPDNFDFLIQNEYRIENDRLIHDKLPPTEEEIRLQKEAKYRSEFETATLMFVRTSAVNLSDEEALNVHMLFEEWTFKASSSERFTALVRTNMSVAVSNSDRY